MGSLVAHATDGAFDAFLMQDNAGAQDVINGDDEIDSLHHKLEVAITSTFALQQPMATDLRTLIAALLITNELERMGDHAEGIAKTVFRRQADNILQAPAQLVAMRKQVVAMIHRVMEAYASDSRERAREAAEMDSEVDTQYRLLFDLIVGQMTSNELSVETGTYFLWAGHNLERIADRVTNISERIIYARTGKINDMNPKGGSGRAS
jgi:phosphate transport system protein